MPQPKGKPRASRPTAKQRRMFDNIVESGSTYKQAMINAGYSEKTAIAPTKVTESKGWATLLEEKVKDKKLLNVLDEGLKAGKTIYKNNNQTGEIENVGFDPDYAVRHKYLETGLKLKGYLQKENPGVAVQVNVNQDRDKFK